MSLESLLPIRTEDEVSEDEYLDKSLNPSSYTHCHDPENELHARRNHSSARRNVFHIALAIFNCLIFAILILRHATEGCHNIQSPRSPAEPAVHYKSTFFNKYGHLGGNPFSQPPGPALDEAWHRLLAGMNIVVDPKWLDPYDADSVRLADNSGVLAQLGVYHELHCLKKLKRWNYRAHYYGNLSDEQLKEEGIHVEHCLEWLRIAALCRSDTTLTTFQWEGVNNSRLATEYPIPRQCVDSEQLLRWSEDRAVDITQEGVLEHK